jgi:hypothetical protein
MNAVSFRSGLLVSSLAAGLLIMALGSPALRAADDIKICVVAVLANDRSVSVDEKISCIAKEVQKEHPSLTCFKVETQNCKCLAVGAKEKFKLVDKEVATVKLEEGPDKNGHVKLSVKVPTLGEITYTVARGKCFPIMTKYQTKDGDRLFVGIVVKPCEGEKKDKKDGEKKDKK